VITASIVTIIAKEEEERKLCIKIKREKIRRKTHFEQFFFEDISYISRSLMKNFQNIFYVAVFQKIYSIGHYMCFRKFILEISFLNINPFENCISEIMFQIFFFQKFCFRNLILKILFGKTFSRKFRKHMFRKSLLRILKVIILKI